MQLRTFHLERHHDESGVSGVGRVAEGVLFSDGRVAMRWIIGQHRATNAYDSIADVEAVHGHGGSTQIVWHDQAAPVHGGGLIADYVPPGPLQ